jgi:hypothetical protein
LTKAALPFCNSLFNNKLIALSNNNDFELIFSLLIHRKRIFLRGICLFDLYLILLHAEFRLTEILIVKKQRLLQSSAEFLL